MNEEQKFLLEKILSRIDSSISSVNSKASFILGFNTFILGSIVLKYHDILQNFSYPKFIQIVPFILLFILGGVVLSSFFIFRATNPFLKAGNLPSSYHSLIFFGSISEMSFEDFTQKIKELNGETLRDDLIRQNHVLAKALNDKFKNISQSMFCLIFFISLPLGILALLKVIEWFLS